MMKSFGTERLGREIFSFARVGSLSSLFRYKKVCFDRSSVCSLAMIGIDGQQLATWGNDVTIAF